MTSNLSFTEQLCFTTVRIVGYDESGNSHTGSGFFYNFLKQDVDGKELARIPTIVTNRHVLEECRKIEFNIPVIKEESVHKGPNDIGINDLAFTKLEVDEEILQHVLIYHPNENVDLGLLDITGLLVGLLEYANQNPFFKTFDNSFILTGEKAISELDAIEEIIMIGYPNGLWDAKNNLPIFRRGITATHPAVDYNGYKEFLIDAACFEGSSGSPVFLYDRVAGRNKLTNETNAKREVLLGVLWGGEGMDIEGEMREVKIPTKKSKPFVEIMLNLGCVIKAERILDFESLIWDKYQNLIKASTSTK